jgi:hypothetical protein
MSRIGGFGGSPLGAFVASRLGARQGVHKVIHRQFASLHIDQRAGSARSGFGNVNWSGGSGDVVPYGGILFELQGLGLWPAIHGTANFDNSSGILGSAPQPFITPFTVPIGSFVLAGLISDLNEGYPATTPDGSPWSNQALNMGPYPFVNGEPQLAEWQLANPGTTINPGPTLAPYIPVGTNYPNWLLGATAYESSLGTVPTIRQTVVTDLLFGVSPATGDFVLSETPLKNNALVLMMLYYCANDPIPFDTSVTDDNTAGPDLWTLDEAYAAYAAGGDGTENYAVEMWHTIVQ